MRDVRGVFAGVRAARARSLPSGLVVAVAGRPPAGPSGAGLGGDPDRGARPGRSASSSPASIAFFAFDAAFEVFHRLFFAGGSYTFDPRTDRLVQLFPFAFWSETTMAVGAVIIAIVARRRGRSRVAGRAARARRRPTPPPAAQSAAPGGGPMNGVPVARLLGIEIRLHLSWIFIIAIITVTVGGRLGSLQPAADADARLGRSARSRSLGFLATVVAHELAHALVAAGSGCRSRRSPSTSSARRRPSTSGPTRRGPRRPSRSPGPLTSLGLGRGADRARGRRHRVRRRRRSGSSATSCSSSARSTSSSPASASSRRSRSTAGASSGRSSGRGPATETRGARAAGRRRAAASAGSSSAPASPSSSPATPSTAS